jgi:hypothetical protein
MHDIAKKNQHSKGKSQRKCKAREKKKKYCTTNSAIVQLHAIVYAVIYYDFRIILWRLSVRNGLIYRLKYLYFYTKRLRILFLAI